MTDGNLYNIPDTESIGDLYDAFEESSGVCTDSRKVTEGVIFFALHGASFDGNDYAVQALSDGASVAVVDRAAVVEGNPALAGRLILVDDTLAALQALAAEHRRRLEIPIIAIVGSSGKTTTKELVSRVLAERYEVYATRGNLNNHIGVPLTLLSMTRDIEFGVVEMGASAQGEIAQLCRIAEPNYGLITNIGRSHLEGFGGVEGIRRGKGELFDFLDENGGRAFVPEEDAVLVGMAGEREDLAVEYYSRAIADGVPTQLVGDYNRYNIAAAVAVGRYFGVDDERIASAVAEYAPDNNRSQEVRTARNRVIVDCYNANPVSMEAAIDSVAKTAGDKVLVLGDMLELGEWSGQEHCAILRRAVRLDDTKILLVGSEFGKAYTELYDDEAVAAADIHWSGTTGEAEEWLQVHAIEGATVLLKGSRRMTLEKLLQYL